MKFKIDDNFVIEGPLFKFYDVKTSGGLMELTPVSLVEDRFLDSLSDPWTFYTKTKNVDGEEAVIVVHQEEDGFEWVAHTIEVREEPVSVIQCL